MQALKRPQWSLLAVKILLREFPTAHVTQEMRNCHRMNTAHWSPTTKSANQSQVSDFAGGNNEAGSSGRMTFKDPATAASAGYTCGNQSKIPLFGMFDRSHPGLIVPNFQLPESH